MPIMFVSSSLTSVIVLILSLLILLKKKFAEPHFDDFLNKKKMQMYKLTKVHFRKHGHCFLI